LASGPELAIGQGSQLEPLTKGTGLGEPTTRIGPSGTNRALEADNDFAVEAATVGFRLLFETPVEGIWQAFDGQRRHGIP
jgi:hypothetical protein